MFLFLTRRSVKYFYLTRIRVGMGVYGHGYVSLSDHTDSMKKSLKFLTRRFLLSACYEKTSRD